MSLSFSIEETKQMLCSPRGEGSYHTAGVSKSCFACGEEKSSIKGPCWKSSTTGKNIWVLSKKEFIHVKKRRGTGKAVGKVTPHFALAGGVRAAANFPNINLTFPLKRQLHKPGNGTKMSTSFFLKVLMLEPETKKSLKTQIPKKLRAKCGFLLNLIISEGGQHWTF